MAVSTRGLGLLKFLFEPRGFIVRHESIDQGSEFAIHDFRELVDGQTDAVIRDAILRIIVGPNFLRAVTCFDLSPTFGPDGSLLLFHFHFVKAGAQDTHGLGAILDL